MLPGNITPTSQDAICSFIIGAVVTYHNAPGTDGLAVHSLKAGKGAGPVVAGEDGNAYGAVIHGDASATSISGGLFAGCRNTSFSIIQNDSRR